jgi:hypothetical protein
MNQLIRYVREYEILGKGLAIVLAVICRGIIWQIYMWLRGSLSIYGHPSLLWTVCILYFAFLLWLFLFLMNSGKRYPGMLKDALLGGCLLTVAAVLHDADVFSVLSGKGFGAAAWVTFLGAGALVISNSASMSRMGRRAGDPPSNSAGDESLPSE